jgi:hypothetical protein
MATPTPAQPSYKFGRLPAKFDPNTPQFADYIMHRHMFSGQPSLPVPPVSDSILTRVLTNLKKTTKDIPTLFPMDGNDTIGDCTIAAVGHAQTVYRGMDSALCVYGSTDLVKLYYQLTGGQDDGLACLDVLHYWNHTDINKDRILAYVSVDPRNHSHVEQAIQLFGGLYIGFYCTVNIIDQFNAGKPWTVGSLTQDGHCVFVEGYDKQYLNVLTWGASQKGTWGWWNECVEECYAIVPPEATNPKFTPGYNVTQLIADMSQLR